MSIICDSILLYCIQVMLAGYFVAPDLTSFIVLTVPAVEDNRTQNPTPLCQNASHKIFSLTSL